MQMYTMTARTMRLLLLFSGLALSLSLAAQYPSNSIKSRLGWQTTGDGLVYRGAGAPAYSPGTLFNAWMYLDTTNYALYMYRNFQWTKLPLVNNGLNLDGSYVQLGGTLVENTQVERSTYTLDFGKISGSNNAWASFYGSDPHYFGVLANKDGTQTGLTIGNKVWDFETTDSDHVSHFSGSRFGFDATYLGTLGVSQFKMDSARFFLRGLNSYASHTAADAAVGEYQLYKIDNSRAIYLKNSAVTSQDILGTGTADRLARWTATNTMAAGNIYDNGTYTQSLLPWKFASWTTAGRPTGVNNYWGYNSTTDWLEGYLSSAGTWVSPLQTLFTGGKGTARYLLFGGSDGRATESADLQFNSTTRTLDVILNTTDNARGINVAQIGGGIIAGAIRFRKSGGGTYTSPTAAANGNLIGAFSFQGYDGVSWPLDVAFFGAKITGSVSTGTVPTSIFFNAGQNINQYNSDLLIYHTGSVGIGRTGNGSVASTMTSPARLLTVYGEARISDLTTDTPTRIVGADADGDLGALSLSGLSIASGVLTGQNFANTNLTATGNRVHDWGNYNFTWTNMKKFMWGADSLFKITKEFSGYTYAVMRQPNGQALLDLQGNANAASNSAELRLTDTNTGNIVFIAHDNRGFGSNGYRMEHYNGSNYHNMLFVDKTSRLFHVNQGGYSSGTFQDGDAAIMTGLLKNISRDAVGTFNTDTIMAVHYFRAKNNLTKNRDVFGIYGDDGAIDTMYFRSDKTGRLFQYKDAFFTRNVSFTQYGQNAKSASALSKTLTNQNAAFATDGTVLEIERKRDTTIFVTADTDYDFSAAVTTAQISRRYNRIIIHMTLTSGVGADKTTTMHTPDANLMQCEILIRGTDNTGTYDNEINFGTNNAISSDGTNSSGYTLAQGQGLHVRVVYNGSAYKYIYY
jgi:hypothetical protein